MHFQVFFIGGIIYGAYLSASLSGTLGKSQPVSQYHALVGGFLMAFGVLLTGGATL